MEERDTSGELLRVDSNVSDWRTNIIAVNGSNHTGISFSEITYCTMIFLSLVCSLFGLVGNAVVLWLLGFHVRKNVFSVYILNLAAADFLFMCFQTVCCLQFILEIFYPSHNTYVFLVGLNFAYLCSLSILSVISIERCLSVLWPIWYRCQRPRHTSAVICTLLWVLSLLLSLLEGKECGLLFNIVSAGWCHILDFIATAWLIALFVVFLGSSLTLVVTVFWGSHRIPVTRLYVVIVSTVLVFLLFGLPYGIYWFLLTWLDTCDNGETCKFFAVTIFLSCVNSCANPIIYFLIGSIRYRMHQRKSLKLLLQRAMQDTPEEEEGGERGPSGRSREMTMVWQGLRAALIKQK
nr:mas-related G-protein coupled receptor member X2-like [Meriones unguiculatus]